MNIVLFGDPFLAERTKRSSGGIWINEESHNFQCVDTLFIQTGSLLAKAPIWTNKKPAFAVGATLEEPEWREYISKPKKYTLPKPKSFFLRADTIKKLNLLRKKNSFWEALEKLSAKRSVDPQLRNWYHGKLRVLQVVTSLHVGGAEKICVELSRMPECIGIATWVEPKRSALKNPNWDLSSIPKEHKVASLVQLAKRLHVDIIHTHLLTAFENAEIEKHFPVITTIHNMPNAWPLGYDKIKPGLLVGCSRAVSEAIGNQARTAWNGISIELTKKPVQKSKKSIAIVAVANYRPQKRLHKIPAIMKSLINKGYSPNLTIVGEVHKTDPESKKSRELFWKAAKKLNLLKKITEVQTLDVRSIHAKNNLFLSVSAYEGLSLSQLEALGAGLPVVATEVGGALEIKTAMKISNAYTTLPPNASSESFADAIIAAAKLPRKNYLPEEFKTETMCRRYLWLYYSALTKGKVVDEMWLFTNNFSMGGAQTSAKRLLKKLSPNIKVRAFTLEELHPTKGSLELQNAGIQTENLQGNTARERVFSLMKKCITEKPRAFFFWNTMSHEKCLIADGLNLPIIDASPGEMYFHEMERYLKNPIVELPVRSSVDYGRLLHTSVVKYGREKVRMKQFLGIDAVVIPNGVEGIKTTVREFNKKQLIFGTASRIAPHKRLEDLIEAFKNTNIPLLIAGRVEPGCEKYAKELKKSSTNNIKWLGEQQINKFLPKLDIFVMISEPSGCPNASLEAMSNGLPMIITDVGGANEQVITGFNGWLTPARDVKAMKEAIQEVITLPPSTLKVMSKASLFQAQQFSIDKMVKSYASLIQ